jgi:hypothetical protein
MLDGLRSAAAEGSRLTLRYNTSEAWFFDRASDSLVAFAVRN